MWTVCVCILRFKKIYFWVILGSQQMCIFHLSKCRKHFWRTNLHLLSVLTVFSSLTFKYYICIHIVFNTVRPKQWGKSVSWIMVFSPAKGRGVMLPVWLPWAVVRLLLMTANGATETLQKWPSVLLQTSKKWMFILSKLAMRCFLGKLCWWKISAFTVTF